MRYKSVEVIDVRCNVESDQRSFLTQTSKQLGNAGFSGRMRGRPYTIMLGCSKCASIDEVGKVV